MERRDYHIKVHDMRSKIKTKVVRPDEDRNSKSMLACACICRNQPDYAHAIFFVQLVIQIMLALTWTCQRTHTQVTGSQPPVVWQ
jgi:hypothetical protein